MTVFADILTAKSNAEPCERSYLIVSQKSLCLLLEAAKPEIRDDASVVTSVYGMDLITHPDMVDDEWLVVRHGVSPDVAVALYLAQRKAKEAAE